MNSRAWMAERLRVVWLVGAAMLYVMLASFQLGRPGLHYDEAKEAGVNAMELISGAPVTAFRGATLDLFGVHLPLMVQDYIGALNVYLVAPILAATGVGVPNLRVLPVLTGLLTLFLAERAISEWIACCDRLPAQERAKISLAGVVAATLLAVSPSFVFWSRQGIFVTNLIQPLCFLCVWQGVHWMRTGRPSALVWSALAAGLALYAKLLAVWIVGPFAVLMLAWWLSVRIQGLEDAPRLGPLTVTAAAAAVLLPLAPLALFNLETGGTVSSVLGNLGRSYYGVDNLDVAANVSVRAGQLAQVLRGDQFWYLGGSFANRAAPWLAAVCIGAGVWRAPRCTLPPVVLVGAAALASVVTISDLFVTHYALLYPFVIAAAAISLDRVLVSFPPGGRQASVARTVVGMALAVWVAGNLWTDVGYHRALAQSGGLADHSDASYHLAYYLRYNGLGAPIVLDWGIEAPVRYLSQGAVRPVEIFGYESLDSPDEQFGARLEQFLPNPDNVYLLHAPGQTVFDGRREAFLHAAEARGLTPELVEVFGQRDGQPLFEVWRVFIAPAAGGD